MECSVSFARPRPVARVARGATYLFFQGLVCSVIGVVYFVVLVRLLTPEEMGVYAVLTFLLALVQVLGTLALPSAAVKYIAQYMAQGKLKEARSVVARVLQVSVLASALLSVLLFASSGPLSILLSGTSVWVFQALAFASFFTVLQIQAGSFLQGLQRMREVAAVQLTYAVVEKFLAVYLLYAGWGLLGVVYGWLVGLIVSSLVGLVLTAKLLGILEKPHPAKPLVAFSYPLYVSGILGFAAGWVDQLFILPYMGAAYLGMYHVAIRAAVVPGLVSSSIVAALFPQLSELYAQQGADGLRDAFQVSTRYTVLVSFPMILGLAALAYPLLILFAGMEYAEAALPLTVLCLAALPGALGIAIVPALLTLERTKTASMVTVVSILSNTVMCYVALAYLNLGMFGVAWARVFSSFAGFGLGVYALRRVIKVAFDKESLWKASLSSIIMTTVVVLVEVLLFHLYFLPLYVIVGFSAYFLSLVGLKAVKKHDVELVHEYLPSWLKRVAVWLSRVAVAE